jgi:hypothetical protein
MKNYQRMIKAKKLEEAELKKFCDKLNASSLTNSLKIHQTLEPKFPLLLENDKREDIKTVDIIVAQPSQTFNQEIVIVLISFLFVVFIKIIFYLYHENS